MDPSQIILFISKYSNNSDKFMKYAQQTDANLLSILNIQIVYVDNQDIHSRILDDNNANITIVPTILCAYPDGTVEKYEGKNAFEWASQLIEPLLAKKQEELNELNNIKQERLKLEQEQKQILKAKQQIEIENKRLAEEAKLIQEKQNQENTFNIRSRAPPPKNSSNELGEELFPNNSFMIQHQQLSQNNQSNKGMTLAEKAAAMQQNREKEDQLNPKPISPSN